MYALWNSLVFRTIILLFTHEFPLFSLVCQQWHAFSVNIQSMPLTIDDSNSIKEVELIQ